MPRNLAALQRFYERIVDEYPSLWTRWSEENGLSLEMARLTPAVLVVRENHGDLAATAMLDQLEAIVSDFERLGGFDRH